MKQVLEQYGSVLFCRTKQNTKHKILNLNRTRQGKNIFFSSLIESIIAFSSDVQNYRANAMLNGAIPFVIRSIDSKQAQKFKTCQGTVLSKCL